MFATILYRIIFNIGSLDAGTAENWFLESEIHGDFLFDSFLTYYPTLEYLQDNPCDLPMVVLDAVYCQVMSQLVDTDKPELDKLAEAMAEQVSIHGNFMCSSYDGEHLPEFAIRFEKSIQRFQLEKTPQMKFFLNMLR